MKKLKYLKFLALLILLTSFVLLTAYHHASAASSNITGKITNSSAQSIVGASVFATNVSGNSIIYGPVLTNSTGNYSLQIPVSGYYDIHVEPPSNAGYGPYISNNITATTDQVINAQLTTQTNTLSGNLTDSANNILSGVTVKLNRIGSANTYTTTTDSNGAYSIPVPAGYYYMTLTGTMSGMLGFTLSQSNTSSINLLSGSLVLNLVIKTANVTVTAHSNGGQELYGGSTTVNARATSGVTSLYPGDPGTAIQVAYSYTAYMSSSPTGTLKTIVGATFAASGLEASSYTTSICQSLAGSVYDCLRTPLTVMSDMAFDMPHSSINTRTFSGTVKDSTGNPVPNVTVALVKYNDTTASAYTDANGAFSINAVPRKYYLKLSGNSIGSMQSFTLTQSSTNPTIDLTGSSMTKDLQLKLTPLSVTAYDSYGNPNGFATVNAQTTAGTTSLYSGDPGESMSIQSNGFSTTSSATGIIGTIVGASYSAKGTNAPNSQGSICELTGGHWDCLTTALTVTGPASVGVPYTP